MCLFSLFVFSVNQNVFAANDTEQSVPLVDQANLSVLAIGVALFSIIGVAVGSFLTWKQLKQDADDKFSNLLIELDNDLTELIKTEQDLKTKDDCDYYIHNYLDRILRIAFLEDTRRVPDSMIIYFTHYFRYALAIKEWYFETEPVYSKLFSDRWESIESWCKNSRNVMLVTKDINKPIEAYPWRPTSDGNSDNTVLPYAFVEYHNLPNKEPISKPRKDKDKVVKQDAGL